MTPSRPCDDWAEAISAYADGEASPGEESSVKEHLAGCDACATWLAGLREDREAYQAAYAVEARPGFAEAVVGRLSDQRQDAAAPGRRGLRGRWIEVAVSGAIVLLVGVLLFPVFPRARERSRQTSCLSNLKQLALGAIMYAQDHGGHLPLSDQWADAILPYVKDPRLFLCPSDESGGKCSYAMSVSVSGAKLEDIPNAAERPLLYDADQSGAFARRHNGGGHVAFVDGHVKWYAAPPEGVPLRAAIGPAARDYGLAEKLHLTYDAGLEVEATDALEALNRAQRIIDEQQGFVLEASYSEGGARPSARLTCKVPATQLGITLQALSRLGRVLNWQVHGADMTAQVMSAESRLRVQEGELARLQSQASTEQRPAEREPAQAAIPAAESKASEARGDAYAERSKTVLATVAATFTAPKHQVGPWLVTVRTLSVAWGWSARVVGTGGAWVVGVAPIWLPLVLIFWLFRLLRRRHGAAAA